MRINNNIMAMNAHRQLGVNSRQQGKSIEKLSSGLRINRAGDDAAGLAISEKMRSQVRGLNQASRNAQDDISLIQTTEGALNETQAIVHRMREMAVQSSNDSNTDDDRAALQAEMDQLAQEVTRIANDTEFNTRKVLNGNLDKSVTNSTGELKFHIGANTNQEMSFSVKAMDAKTLGLSRDLQDTAAKGSVVAGNDVAVKATTTATTTAVGAEGNNDKLNGYTISFEKVNGYGTPATVDAKSTGQIQNIGASNHQITATGANNDATLNGVKIVFANDDDNNISATYDASSKTYTVKGDWDNSGSNAPGNLGAVATAINNVGTGPANSNNITLSGDATVAELASAGTLTLGGGSAQSAGGGDAASASISGKNITVKVQEGTTLADIEGLVQGVDTTSVSDADVKAAIANISLSTAAGAAAPTGKDLISKSIEFEGGTNKADSAAAKFDADGNITDAKAAAGIDITTQDGANKAIKTIDSALKKISDVRAGLGAVQNRLEHTIKNVDTAAENLQASESRIRDVDMAKEMMNYTKNNILSQAAQSMLAQANQAPQGVLQLLR